MTCIIKNKRFLNFSCEYVKFIQSGRYYISLAFLAIVLTVLPIIFRDNVSLRENITIVASVFFVSISAINVILSGEILFILYPSLLAIIVNIRAFSDDMPGYPVATKFFNISLAIVCVLLVISSITIFILYRGKFIKGRLFWPILFVSIAIMISGIGTLQIEQYSNPERLIQYLALGPGTLFLYLLFVNFTNRNEDIDAFSVIAHIFLCTAFAIAVIFVISNLSDISFRLNEYAISKDISKEEAFSKLPIKQLLYSFVSKNTWKNTMGFIYLLSISSIFYFMKKSENKIRYYILALFFLFIAFMSKSRNIQLSSTVIFIALSIYAIYILKGKEKKIFYIFMFILAIAIFAILIYVSKNSELFINKLNTFFTDQFRPKLYKEAIEDFIKYPIFGRGIIYMPNKPIYNVPVTSLYRVHNNVLQVVGKLGICGIITFIYLIRNRIKIIKMNKVAEHKAISIGFYSIFLLLGIFDVVGFEMILNMMLLFVFAISENQIKKDNDRLKHLEEERNKYCY